jgi:uncharacterized protein
VRIGLLSDTHNYLPQEVFTYFKDVDEIWHAGDIGNIELLQQLEAFKPTRAVWGNIDGATVRAATKEYLFFEINGVSFLIMHIGGYPTRYNLQSKALIAQYKPQIFIVGHSHIVKVLKDASKNLLHLNPGACGKQGWHKVKTIMRFEIGIGKIDKLELIELDEK